MATIEELKPLDKRPTQVIKAMKSEDGEKLFQRVVLALTLATHPNVVRMWQHCKIYRAFVIAMEWLGGGKLDSLLAELADEDFFPLAFSMQFSKDRLSSLHFLHNERNIAHRGLKPENVFFDQHKQVKFVDFSFTKLTR